MKKLIITTLSACFLAAFSIETSAQITIPDQSPAASVSQALGLGNVTVNYSRPSAKGRMIFGGLVPYDKVWRTGANKISNIELSTEMKINGTPLQAGKYGLFTIPGKETWKIILNRKSEQWGAYEYDPVFDAISFEVQPIDLDHNVNQMSIDIVDFESSTAYIQISWETTAVKFKVEHDIKPKILAQIETEMAKGNIAVENYFTAAEYYYQNNYKLPQALKWAQEAVSNEKEYWTYQLVARIAAKMGMCEQAVPAARESLKLAKIAGDDAYILLNEHSLMVCGEKID